uniref:Zinc finger, CCHC-type n=1 Tax=Tanacetum cinerariifolium TaxID=118510 RepID=A0A6L2MMQ4_TANCI|nr:zinc finger, CCHC-type [Tanacetum cinerariifolium]
MTWLRPHHTIRGGGDMMRYISLIQSEGDNDNQLLLNTKIDRENPAMLEQASRADLYSRPPEQTLEQYFEDSWTIKGWFRSEVSSIGVGQTSTITRGDKRTDQDHNSLVVNRGAKGDTSEGTKAEPDNSNDRCPFFKPKRPTESLTIEDVLATLNSRELKKRTEGTKKKTSDGLYIRGKSNHSDGHLKRDYPMKKSSGFVKKGKRDHDFDYFDDEGNAYFREALAIVGNDEMTELVADSGGSYHMTQMRDFLYDFLGFDGGLVQLSDNNTSTIKGIRKVKIQFHDRSSFILKDVRYVPGLRKSLILLGTLEKEDGIRFSRSIFLIKYHWGGVFVRDPLSYDYEILSEIPNVDLVSLGLAGFMSLLETEFTSFVKSLFYLVPSLNFHLGLKPLKCKADFNECVQCGVNNDHVLHVSEESHTTSVDHLSDDEEEVLAIKTKKRDPTPKKKASKMFDESFFTSIFNGLPRDDFDDSSDPNNDNQDKLEMLTCRRTSQVRSHHQNSKEAGVSKEMLVLELLALSNAAVPKENPKKLGDEGLCSGGTMLNLIFIIVEQAKMKATPRKLAYADSDKEAPAGVYEGNKEEWPMPIWCKMFRQTQGGVAQNWFDDMDPKSVDSFEELRKQIEEAVASGKLAHLVKDIRRNNQQNGNPGRNDVKVINMIRQEGNCKRSFEERRSGPTSDPMSLEKTWGQENAKEAFIISHEHPDQYVTMETTLTTNCNQLLTDVLWENRESKMPYLCFLNTRIRLNSPFSCVTWLSVCTLDRPIGKEGCASWDGGKGIWGGREKGFGTVPVCVRVQESEYGWGVFWRENLLRGTVCQIRITEDDEEKTDFHTEEGVYCFTHMPKELKKLRCNTSEDDGKAISKFIPKLTELKHPIHEARTRMETAKESVWTNETEEALRMIKRKLSKNGRNPDTCFLCKLTAAGNVKKFSGQGEQVEETPDANKGRIFDLSKEFQANSTPTTRAWRLYLCRETIEEGLGVGIILISLEEKMYSYAIRLKFKASNHAMDCEALLARLVASANQGMATIKLEFLNQEVSVGIKTRPSVEETNSSKKGKATSNALGEKPNCNHEASGSN